MGQDLASLLADYEKELARAGLADLAELLATAAEIAKAGHPLLGMPLLFLDVPIETAREMEFVPSSPTRPTRSSRSRRATSARGTTSRRSTPQSSSGGPARERPSSA